MMYRILLEGRLTEYKKTTEILGMIAKTLFTLGWSKDEVVKKLGNIEVSGIYPKDTILVNLDPTGGINAYFFNLKGEVVGKVEKTRKGKILVNRISNKGIKELGDSEMLIYKSFAQPFEEFQILVKLKEEDAELLELFKYVSLYIPLKVKVKGVEKFSLEELEVLKPLLGNFIGDYIKEVGICKNKPTLEVFQIGTNPLARFNGKKIIECKEKRKIYFNKPIILS
jgi:hypothetical protein